MPSNISTVRGKPFYVIFSVLCPWITDICTMLLQTTGVDKGWILEFSRMGDQSRLTFRNLMDYTLPDSSVLGISQAKILEWVATPSSRGSSWPRDGTQVSCVSCIMGFLHSSVGKESACNAGDPGLIPASGRSAGEGIGYPLQYSWAFCVVQLIQNPPVMRKTWVQSLVWEDPLEKGKVTHSSILSMGLPRQECWNGLPHLPPENLPDPGIDPKFSCVSCIGRRDFYLSPWEAHFRILREAFFTFWPQRVDKVSYCRLL